MTYTLLPVPKAQFFDNNGVPLNGGKVYTYEAGTTTPKDTYVASDGAANLNPVILDSAGRANIWLDGNYKITLTDANDVPIYTVDDVTNNSVSPVYTGGTVTGSATALVVSATTPDNFDLITGAVIFITPTQINTGSSTINVAGSGAITIKKGSPSGLVNLDAGDLAPTIPLVLYYNGTNWVAINIIYAGKTTAHASNFTLAFTDLFVPVVATADITITLTQTLFLPPYFYADINAYGGNVTLTPNAADSINGGTVGASITISKGLTARLYTDGAGNWYTNFLNVAQQGGMVNKFRNGSFDVAQRGTVGTVTSGSTNYTLDGWYVSATGATATWSQAYGTVIGERESVLVLTGNAGMTGTTIGQRIEGTIAAPLAGKVVTVQFQIQNLTGASITPTLTVRHAGSLDNWGAPVTDVNAVSLTAVGSGTAAQLAYTFIAVGGAANGLEVIVDFGASINANTKVISLGLADIRVTPTAQIGINTTPPPVERRPIAFEMTFCQRYLAAFGNIAGVIGTGAATSTSASGYNIPFNVPMRIAPTGLTAPTPGNFQIVSYAGANVAAATGLTFNSTYSSNVGAFIAVAVAATPLTSATPYMLSANTALAGNLLFTGAEL